MVCWLQLRNSDDALEEMAKSLFVVQQKGNLHWQRRILLQAKQKSKNERWHTKQ